jgi:hypothetical protein
MKIKSGLTLLGAAVFFATAPAAFAGKDAAETEVVDPAVCEMAPEDEETVVEAQPVSEEEIIDETEVLVDEEAGEEIVPEDCAHEEGEPCVREDWVKRGGEDNPEIYYNTAVDGEPAVLKGDTEAVIDLGQDEKASAIDTKTEKVTPLVTGQKKGPVALVKKGRVFLR